MDRGKKPSNPFVKHSKIYMDLKDIVREHALPFLPAKSLRRCRGVCRDWRLAVSTPFFAHSQSISFNRVSGFFSQATSGLPSFVPLDPMAHGVPDPSLAFLPEPVDIRTSSNGLLCCQGRTGDKAYYICNPVNQQYKKLPKPEADHGTDPVVVLIYEPSLLNFVAEYKLVCAFPSELDGIEFEIYSSDKGTWRISADICFGETKLLPTSGVHMNGSVYWQSNRGILAFDLKTERSKILYCGSGTMGVMNKKLCSATLRGQRVDVSVLSNTHTNTMQMSSHVKSWVPLKLQIDLNITAPAATSNSYGEVTTHFMPRPIHDVRDGLIFFNGDLILVRSGTTLNAYDMKTKTTTTLSQVESRSKIFSYVNSLVEI